MYCGKCGKEISERSKFCRVCGAPVTSEHFGNYSPFSISMTAADKNHINNSGYGSVSFGHNHKRIVFFIIFIIILISGAFVINSVAKSAHKNKTAKQQSEKAVKQHYTETSAPKAVESTYDKFGGTWSSTNGFDLTINKDNTLELTIHDPSKTMHYKGTWNEDSKSDKVRITLEVDHKGLNPKWDKNYFFEKAAGYIYYIKDHSITIAGAQVNTEEPALRLEVIIKEGAIDEIRYEPVLLFKQ